MFLLQDVDRVSEENNSRTSDSDSSQVNRHFKTSVKEILNFLFFILNYACKSLFTPDCFGFVCLCVFITFNM